MKIAYISNPHLNLKLTQNPNFRIVLNSLLGQVHLGEVLNGVVQSVGDGGINGLLALHRPLHNGVVCLQRVDIVLVGLKNASGLDTLAEAVLGDGGYDLAGVLLLGVNPPGHLVEVEGEGLLASGELVDLKHGLADSGRSLLYLSNNGRIVEDAAGNLAVPATEAEHEVEGALLLDIVVREGAAILELLAGEDQTLLVRRDALLVLDLLLDVVDCVARLDVEGDGLSGEGLDEDLRRWKNCVNC